MVVNNRVWAIGAAILMIAILALGYFLGVAPRLAEVSANETQRQSVEQQNEIYRTALTSLEDDFKHIADFKADLAELQKALPPGADLSRFIGALRELEAASGVALTNFSSEAALPFSYTSPIPPAIAVAPTETPAEGDAATTEGAPAAAEPVVEVDPNALVQTLSPDEFVYLGIDLTVSGTQAQVLDFVSALQNNDRRYLVTGLSIITEDGVTFTGTITGYVYVLIDPSKPAGDDSTGATLDGATTETTTP